MKSSRSHLSCADEAVGGRGVGSFVGVGGVIYEVKFECKLGSAGSGAKVCMGKKMSVSFPTPKRVAGEPLKLQFSVLAIL